MALAHYFAVPFLICIVLVIVFRHFAEPLGLIDHPVGRKMHGEPVPAVGGIAMYFAVAPAIYWAMPGGARAFMLVAFGMLVLVGVLDDRFLLRPRHRFLTEFAAALVLAVSGQTVGYLGNLAGFGPVYTGSVAIAFSLVCYVGLINATNMIDGIDGLAGSLSLVSAVFFTGIALAAGDGSVAAVGMATCGALCAFLVFNLRTRWRARASVFMGDAGSMFLGCLLAWFAITLAGRTPSLLTPIGAVWILAVPLLDMGSVMLHRIRQGRSPFDGDRRHLHYRLIDAGMSVRRAVSLLTALAFGTGVLGVGFPALGIPEWAMFYLFIGAWFVAYRRVARSPAAPRESTVRPVPTNDA